ncbi:MAG: type IV secretion protein IcmB, partial [Alphaproteobacteria bacterium]|nr:type IV secretion protein IcmB [Alphaproteobacteria bacterium]
IGDEEYNWIVDQSTLKLGAKFDRVGHALQLYFMRDPGAAAYTLDKHLKINRRAAENLELDMADLIGERRRNLLRYLAHEDIFLACWTRTNAIPPNDRKKAEDERKDIKWVKANRAQYPHMALDPMRMRHKSYVMGVAAALEELGIKCKVMDVHEALAAVRTSIYPYLRNDEWRANLPGDPITARAIKYQNDFSDVLWPALRHQMCVGEAEIMSNTIVRVGDWLWAPVDLTLAPSDPAPFTQLLQRLIDSETPFRMSILMESGGIEGLGFKRALAAILAFTNSTNRQIKNSIETLQVLATREPVVKLRISFATFGPRHERKLVESRLASLTQAAESWGYCQVTSATGDPLEATMTSALGVACASTAPPVVAPLREVMKIIPWQRSCSPFEEGAVLFRTHDGRLWPYQMGTTLTTTWFDLIFAQPGSGKSVLMNTVNLGTCLSAGVGQHLPYVAVLDIGPSSSGLISLLRESLPPDRRYEALHFRMRMTPEYAVNPFDTQLGCRFPTADERAYLVELLTLISTPPGQEKPYDGMAQLCGFVVDEMYRWRCDTGNNTEPRPYLPRVESDVDMAIERYNIELPPEPYWWEIVDALHDLGLHHEASLAQRHAVPT